jgi:L-amino acid N-acyltransferase YncA
MPGSRLKGLALRRTYRLVPMGAEHARAVVGIFNYYVEHSFAAFPEAPVPERFFEGLVAIAQGYPAVVALAGEDAETAGFGLLHAWHPASAFARTAEIGYFLHPRYVGKGLGNLLLAHLLDAARAQGIEQVLARISSRNDQSLAFHRNHGFAEVGRFANVGRKFDQSFDVVWMQKSLA